MKLQGSIIATSNVSGAIKLPIKLQGSIPGASGTFGSLNSQPECISYIIENSGITGVLSVDIELQGFIISISNILGAITPPFSGFVNGISNVVGKSSFVSLGFYESLANQISTYFQDIVDVNNLVVRYDNDLRATPTDDLWCEYNIDFGEANQSGIGIDSFRNVGNFVVKLKNYIRLGTGELYEKADIIADSFRSTNLNRIIFRVPKVRRIGRIKDNYQVTVICPFFVDKIGK